MSATSSTSPTSPIDHKDIRSAARPSKRDKDHGSKWSNGQRPGAGVHWNWMTGVPDEELTGGSEAQREKVRPQKLLSQVSTEKKPTGNKSPKPSGSNSGDMGGRGGRISNKINAILETQDHTSSPLSRSLLDILPKHVNNTDSAINTTYLHSSADEYLYSFDNKGPTPSARGSKVELEGLVDKAEKRWANEQTEKIVRGEYEVLDGEGETTSFKKGKKSPKQKATIKNTSADFGKAVEVDDGFELI